MSSDTFPPVQNYGPLTTIFTPASSCTRVAFQSNVPFVVTTIAGGHPDCYPGSRLYQLHYGFLSGHLVNPYYSPALFCPQGYTTATTWAASIGGISDSPKPDDSEQAYYCCPSSYYLGDWGNCYSTLTQGQSITNEILDHSSWFGGYTTTVNEYATVTAVAWSIQIRYHRSDLTRTPITTSATPSGDTSLPRSGGSATQLSALTSDPPPPSISLGLSTGAKAAIGVTIPVAFIALILGVFLFIRRSRKRNLVPPSPSELDHGTHFQRPEISFPVEMDASTKQPQYPTKATQEADSTPILEK